jgi:hypothetical protein
LEPPRLLPLGGLLVRPSRLPTLSSLVVVVVVLEKVLERVAVAVRVVCCLEQQLLIQLFPIR